MRAYLAECVARAATIVYPRGYEMVSAHLPPAGQSLPDVLRHGVPMFGCDKRQVFKRDAIVDIGYLPGRHVWRPTGRVVATSPDEAKLLHYKYVAYDGYHVHRQTALGRACTTLAHCLRYRG